MKHWILVFAALLTAAAPATRHGTSGNNASTNTAASQPPVAGDWNSYVRVSPTGTYIVGNPRAPVKLVEYLSYTCPHCAAFARESAAVLRRQMIKSGSVMIEYHPAVRDQVDLSASLLVKCIGPKRFADASEAVFAHQDDWLPLAIGFLQNDARRFALDPPLAQMKTTAQLSGLIDLFRGQGMTNAELDRCFTDTAALNQVAALGDGSRTIIRGTPTFFVNGVKTDSFQWSKLEPELRAKGAK